MKFDELDVHGKQIVIETPVKKMLVEVLMDTSLQQSERDRVAQILKYYDAVANKPAETELDRAEQVMLAEFNASCLWNSPDTYTVDPVKGFVIVEKPIVTVPTPAPQQKPFVGQRDAVIANLSSTQSSVHEPGNWAPRICDPIQEQAIAGMACDFRFSPANVARRLAEIEKEAAELRRIRDQQDII